MRKRLSLCRALSRFLEKAFKTSINLKYKWERAVRAVFPQNIRTVFCQNIGTAFRQNIGTFFRQNRQGSLQEFFRKLPERSFFETIFVKATLFSGGVMKMPPRPAKQFLS